MTWPDVQYCSVCHLSSLWHCIYPFCQYLSIFLNICQYVSVLPCYFLSWSDMFSLYSMKIRQYFFFFLILLFETALWIWYFETKCKFKVKTIWKLFNRNLFMIFYLSNCHSNQMCLYLSAHLSLYLSVCLYIYLFYYNSCPMYCEKAL